MGDSVFYSAVYGYRPPFLRLDYPKPDLRFFVEAVGEHTARGQHHGFEMVVSGGDSILVGPTALLLYKQYGLEAGLLFRCISRRTSSRRRGSASGQLYVFFLAEIVHA